MNYTKNQIKRILSIQEFLETTNTLSKIYKEFGNKEFKKENITDRQRIYKLFCSSMYNLVYAIKKSKEIFEKCKAYNLFEQTINSKYVSNNNKYCSKENYESNLYKILAEIRHQNNHFEKDDNDDIVLFEINIDFCVIDELRILINEVFYEIYNKINKEKIKQVILEKPKIKYSLDRLTETIDNIESKYHESTNQIDKMFESDNKRVLQLMRKNFNPDNIYNILNNDKETIEKYDLADKEMSKLFNKQYKYISEHGKKKKKK